MWGLLGPNGSGKSTLFRILATLLPVQDGDVRICGVDVRAQQHEARRHLAVTFQSPALDVRLTGMENLRCQAALYGISRALLRERLGQLQDRLRIKDVLSAPVGTLSGGFRRRIELAKVLLHRPELLLLDEPTTGLDVAARHDFWSVLRELAVEAGTTVLVATHLMEEAEQCDELLLLSHGQVAATGSPAALRSRLPGQRIRIRSRTPDDAIQKLKPLLGVPSIVKGDEAVWNTEQQFDQMSALIALMGAELTSVELSQPTLEDVFLSITGKPLTDAAPEPAKGK